ncbi:hypothetical protein J2Y66_000883 [Paenarthrobacter nitroguajacolicus]|uniref:hypothetical protein n=1 Tax=Paenarthrobacter TaxID=1742992 RepID=UPI0028629A81|nr:hypothetical protein [Paenarthrobacter nitroguajacolicus]MDR6986413.1 hypothetical protein [Paenarthrobacter nitroguajacolicus]
MKRVPSLAIGGLLVSILLASSCAGEPAPEAVDRMVNLGFEDVVNSEPGYLAKLSDRLDSVDATAVSISVGRTDWTAFPWPGHVGSGSSEVSRTGRDFVAESISALEFSENGKKRDVILTIDALLGHLLKDDPSIAGRTMDGVASGSFASVWSLRHGIAGTRLASLAATIAEKYKPTAVNLTELMFDDFTFGSDDLEDFKITTDSRDWPRNSDGSINAEDPRINTWRSEAMADIVRKVRAAVEPFGVNLDMDVRSPRDSASGDRADSGHDYDLLLKQVDRLHVWQYVGLNNERSPKTRELVESMNRRAGPRMSLSLGLWSEDGRMPAGEFAGALREAALGGAVSVSVTPASLMEDQHWEELRKAWAGEVRTVEPIPRGVR